jgi:hypothetical protein
MKYFLSSVILICLESAFLSQDVYGRAGGANHFCIVFQEAWLNSLVTAEVVFWFFVGECIGKRSIVGYHV